MHSCFINGVTEAKEIELQLRWILKMTVPKMMQIPMKKITKIRKSAADLLYRKLAVPFLNI